MALDAAAALAAAEAITVAMIDPSLAPLLADPANTATVATIRANAKASFAVIVGAIFDAIKANAVIDPVGAPTRMQAGGDNVTGTGKVV